MSEIRCQIQASTLCNETGGSGVDGPFHRSIHYSPITIHYSQTPLPISALAFFPASLITRHLSLITFY
jgi:hypothetical protein